MLRRPLESLEPPDEPKRRFVQIAEPASQRLCARACALGNRLDHDRLRTNVLDRFLEMLGPSRGAPGRAVNVAGGAALFLDLSAIVALCLRISLMTSTVAAISPAAACVADWMPSTWDEMSSVARAVCVASVLTPAATTAKPRPASPARAASMVALSASRLVWPAISLINSTTLPIWRCRRI